MTNTSEADTPPAAGFPYATALVTLAALFLFVGLVLLMYRSPNLLGETKQEPATNPVEKLDEVRARNKAVLDGHDPTVKMSADQAAAALVEQAAKSKDQKSPHGRLPFPVESKSDGGKKP